MSISGSLQDFSLTDLVQTISVGKRSGRLRLSSVDSDGLIVFRKGKVIYVASSSIRATLGSLLIREGLVSETDLEDALEAQRVAPTEIRLGTLLIEMGVVTEEKISEVIANQAIVAFSEFLAWEGGYFSYDPMELPDRGEVEVDALDFVSEDGIRTDQMLLEIANRMDELERGAVGERVSTIVSEDSASEGSTPTDESESESSFNSLKSMIEEIRSPHYTGEIAAQIASLAQQLFEHWIVFTVDKRGFGVLAESKVSRVLIDGQHPSAEFLIPADAPSILSEVQTTKETVLGPIAATDWNLKLIEHIGDPQPKTSVAVPMSVTGQVKVILYASSLRAGASQRWLEELELLLMQIGLTVERDLLERQFQHFEELQTQN